jgi:hypothetical protein
VESWTRVDLPSYVAPPFEVYVNGVAQTEGTDYELEGTSLFFNRRLVQEGKLGFWRWLAMVLGIAGTYRPHDSIDLVSTVNGQRVVVPLAPAEVPAGATVAEDAELR